MTDALTLARQAVKNAVENWPALSGVFRRKYFFDGDDSPEVMPTIQQLPAIAVDVRPFDSDMQLTRVTDIAYAMRADIFTETWDLEKGSEYAIEFLKSLWQSGTSPGYVKAATGFYPREGFTIEHTRTSVKDGNEQARKALMTTVNFELRLRLTFVRSD